MSAGHNTTTTTGNAVPTIMSSGARHDNCVTQDNLLSTVKALVDYFEHKINDLANLKTPMKTGYEANKESSVEIVEKI